jgi:tetratricopeptide (TPR) repeat protein
MMGDSAAAHDRFREYESLAGDDVFTARDRIRLGLAFGDSATHERTVTALDTVPVEVLQAVLFGGVSLRYLAVLEEAVLALEARGESLEFGSGLARAVISMSSGRIEDTWPVLREISIPQLEAAFASGIARLGVSVPTDIVDMVFEAGSETASTPWFGSFDAADGFRASLAWEIGRPEIYDARLEALANAREQARAAGDTAFVRRAEAAALLARAVKASEEEGAESALPLVRQAHALEPQPALIGDYLFRAGRAAEAIPYLEYAWDDSWAWYQLGQAYEQQGEPARARDAYQVFVQVWSEADPELQPHVEHARERLLLLIDSLD